MSETDLISFWFDIILIDWSCDLQGQLASCGRSDIFQIAHKPSTNMKFLIITIHPPLIGIIGAFVNSSLSFLTQFLLIWIGAMLLSLFNCTYLNRWITLSSSIWEKVVCTWFSLYINQVKHLLEVDISCSFLIPKVKSYDKLSVLWLGLFNFSWNHWNFSQFVSFLYILPGEKKNPQVCQWLYHVSDLLDQDL